MKAVLWLAVAVTAASLFVPLSATWSLAPDLGHAWVVPLLMAYLWWERWNERPAIVATSRVTFVWWIAALALGALHLVLRLFLTPFPLWPAALLAFTLVTVAIVLSGAWLLSRGAGVRWIAGPLLLLAGALPIPSAIENALVIPLRSTWAALAAEISNVLGQPAIALGTSVRIGGAWVGVDEACGGIRSLQACILAGLFFGEWLRFSFFRRGILLCAAIFAALLGNFVRVLFLSLRAADGPDALAAAHDPAGWIAMAFSLVVTGFLACHWNGYRWPDQRVSASRPPSQVGHTTRSLVMVWITALATLLLANETATRMWYRLGQQASANVPQWSVAFPEEHWSYRAAPLSDVAREMLNPDVYRAGSWQTAEGLRAWGYYIEWNRGQVARSIPFLHNPTICLPAAGCELVATLEPIEVLTTAGPVPFRSFKFRQSGEELLVAFTIWDPSRGRPLQQQEFRSLAAWWHAQWTEVLEARQHQPAQLFTVATAWTPDSSDNVSLLIGRLIRPEILKRTL